MTLKQGFYNLIVAFLFCLFMGWLVGCTSQRNGCSMSRSFVGTH